VRVHAGGGIRGGVGPGRGVSESGKGVVFSSPQTPSMRVAWRMQLSGCRCKLVADLQPRSVAELRAQVADLGTSRIPAIACRRAAVLVLL